MIFNFANVRCIFEVLKLLNTGTFKYTDMFQKTKVSHTTLQSVLRELKGNGLVKKYDKGHQNVDYEITEKGKTVLVLLTQLNHILK